MKLYVISFAAGLLVGSIYSAMGVRSPAPPLVALLGLLGMLFGAQAVPFARRLMHGEPPSVSWLKDESITGVPPVAPVVAPKDLAEATPQER
jgi:XapX domain-containing protein